MLRQIIIISIFIFSLPLSLKADNLSSARKGVKYSTDVLAIGMPVATLAYEIATSDWQGIKQASLTAATTAGVTYILKYTIHKRRPDGSDNHSFPSMHTATTFANAAFLQRRFGWKIGIPAYCVATYVGWGRTFAKKHDWYDVIAGAAIGAGSAYIFTRPFAQKHQLAITPLSDGSSFLIAASLTF